MIQISNITNGLLVLISSLASALITVLVGRRLRWFDIQERTARTEVSLNIDVHVRVFATKRLPIEESRTIVFETRVDIKNNSRQVYCVPAVYISARALIHTTQETYDAETDFTHLPKCGRLSNITNVARIERSIVQLAPDEVERFVRWDTLDEHFQEEYPVVVVNIEAFGCSAKLLGEFHAPKYKVQAQRADWLRFMEQDGGVRHRYVVFDRWNGANQSLSKLRSNARYLKLTDGTPDISACQHFDSVLQGIVQWTRHTTVDLRTPDFDLLRQTTSAYGDLNTNPKEG